MHSFLHSTIALCLTFVCATALAADGDLDPSFGSGGKRLLTVAPFNQPVGATLVANDVAIQPDGKILITGYGASSGSSEWIVVRLNADGSYDSTFGISQNGIVYAYVFGPPDNQAASIALRPNGKIVVGGTINDSNNGLVTAVAIQLNADGSNDTTWGNGGSVYFTPPAGAATRTRAIVLDRNQYSLGTLYLVGQYTDTASHNNFFYGGISADGHTHVSDSYQASIGPNVSESATSVAVQPGTGNIIVGGFAANAIGEVHCAAISTVISANPVFPTTYLYTPWGTNGATSVYFSMAPHNNDYCDAMALDASGYMMLGGHGSTASGGATYDSAITALFDNAGHLMSAGHEFPHDTTYAFGYDGQPGNGEFNTINRLIADPYDTQFPKFLTVGHGFDSAFFPGTTQDFGVGRLIGTYAYIGTVPDTTFSGGASSNPGFSMIDYSVCTAFSCSSTSNAHAQSAAFDAHGRLVIVGSASNPAGGSDIALARLQPFDGIFKNGFDTPSY